MTRSVEPTALKALATKLGCKTKAVTASALIAHIARARDWQFGRISPERAAACADRQSQRERAKRER